MKSKFWVCDKILGTSEATTPKISAIEKISSKLKIIEKTTYRFTGTRIVIVFRSWSTTRLVSADASARLDVPEFLWLLESRKLVKLGKLRHIWTTFEQASASAVFWHSQRHWLATNFCRLLQSDAVFLHWHLKLIGTSKPEAFGLNAQLTGNAWVLSLSPGCHPVTRILNHRCIWNENVKINRIKSDLRVSLCFLHGDLSFGVVDWCTGRSWMCTAAAALFHNDARREVENCWVSLVFGHQADDCVDLMQKIIVDQSLFCAKPVRKLTSWHVACLNVPGAARPWNNKNTLWGLHPTVKTRACVICGWTTARRMVLNVSTNSTF